MRETWVQSLGWEDLLEKGKSTQLQHPGLESSMDCIVHGVPKSQTRLSKFNLRRELSIERQHRLELVRAVHARPAESETWGRESAAWCWCSNLRTAGLRAAEMEADCGHLCGPITGTDLPLKHYI